MSFAELFAAGWFALNQRAHTLWPVKVTLMALCVILFAPILTLWLGTARDVEVAWLANPARCIAR